MLSSHGANELTARSNSLGDCVRVHCLRGAATSRFEAQRCKTTASLYLKDSGQDSALVCHRRRNRCPPVRPAGVTLVHTEDHHPPATAGVQQQVLAEASGPCSGRDRAGSDSEEDSSVSPSPSSSSSDSSPWPAARLAL